MPESTPLPAWIGEGVEMYAVAGRGPDYTLTAQRYIRHTATLIITCDEHGREERWRIATLRKLNSEHSTLMPATDPQVRHAQHRRAVGGATNELRTYLDKIRIGAKYLDNDPETALDIVTTINRLSDVAGRRLTALKLVNQVDTALDKETDPS